MIALFLQASLSLSAATVADHFKIGASILETGKGLKGKIPTGVHCCLNLTTVKLTTDIFSMCRILKIHFGNHEARKIQTKIIKV